MRRRLFFSVVLLPFGLIESCGMPGQQGEPPADRADEEIIALERSALDRWIMGNPQGYLDLYATDVTYFDPFGDKRVDGLEAMTALLAPMKDVKFPFTSARYEMIDPKVQGSGDVRLLTFNSVSYAKVADRPESVVARWNATEVYHRAGGSWKILHSHWSFVKPEIKQPGL